MEKNSNHINKDIHYFCKMRPIQSIFGIGFTSSSDALEWFECYVDEERYKVEDNYKITLRAIDGRAYEHFYQSDFLHLMWEGFIVPKTSDDIHVEYVSFDEPIPNTIAYIHHEGQLQYCSSDKVREELYGDENIQGDPNKVFRVLHNKVKNLLNRGYDVIYDATNVTRKNRRSIIQEVKKYCDEIEAHIIWAPVGQCISRDRDRKRSVGEDVIRKFLHRWQSPFYDEGFTKIKVVHNTNINFDPINFRNMMIENMKIPHDNPHHTLGVWEHCQATSFYVNDKFTDIAVREAAPIHDVGKPWVKGFESDENGKMLPIAHYYQHHCVGGYLVYGMYDLVAEKPAEAVAIVVSWLVSNHMEPFFDSKYYRTLQPELKKLIDELHEADVAAH